MSSGTTQLPEILARINREGIDNVRFEFLDINAVARSRTVLARHFEGLCRSGVRFPMASFVFDTQGNLPVVESNLIKKFSFSDMVCYPDLSTYEVLPWVRNTGRVFVSRAPTEEEDPGFMIDPRNIANAQLKALANMGLTMLSSFELEFWLVDEGSRKPITETNNTMATLRLSKHHDLLDNIAKNLTIAGVDVENFETEYSPGQFEMTMQPSFGIRSADNAATFRTGVKEMALQEGLAASFMGMPFENFEGSASHLNHSLWSPDGKTTMLYSASDPRQLSEIGEHWIAGLLEHAPALSVLQAPTLNCREFFKPATFAPINATWGRDNRTCAVRLKQDGARGMFIENRLGSGAGNPYVILASTIAAGIDGINRQLPLPPPVPTNVVANEEESTIQGAVLLPRDMESALNSLKGDAVMVDAMGRVFIDAFESIRRSDMTKVDGEKFAWARRFYYDYI